MTVYVQRNVESITLLYRGEGIFSPQYWTGQNTINWPPQRRKDWCFKQHTIRFFYFSLSHFESFEIFPSPFLGMQWMQMGVMESSCRGMQQGQDYSRPSPRQTLADQSRPWQAKALWYMRCYQHLQCIFSCPGSSIPDLGQWVGVSLPV